MKFFSYARKHPIFFGIIIVLFSFITSYGVKIRSGKAILPFGGVITAAVPCDCSGGVGLFVLGPIGAGVFLYETGISVPFPYYQFWRPGPFIVGSYVPGGVCMVGVPPLCGDAFSGAGFSPGSGTIIMAGTSM